MNKDFRANLSQLKKRAFTLAETLIVMGIIGVVAALTLPNLNSSTGEKEKVAKVKKIYSDLNDAFGRAQAVYGPFDEWFVNDGSDYDKMNKRAFDRITEFLKSSKVCDTSTQCAIPIIDQLGSSVESNRAVILADGATVVFSIERYFEPEVDIDIDGPSKGPNRPGKDSFVFFISQNDGIYIDNYVMSDSKHYVRESLPDYINPRDAAAWIINFDNMDYLKTSDGTTCPDGKTKLTSGGNHSCK